MAKIRIPTSGIIYSTNPDFRNDDEKEEINISMPAADQQISIRLDKKHRAGKAVTLLEGFSGTDTEKEEIGKKLKTHCGTGGSVKEGEIIIQGDNRDKILQWLHKQGFAKAKKI